MWSSLGGQALAVSKLLSRRRQEVELGDPVEFLDRQMHRPLLGAGTERKRRMSEAQETKSTEAQEHREASVSPGLPGEKHLRNSADNYPRFAEMVADADCLGTEWRPVPSTQRQQIRRVQLRPDETRPIGGGGA